MTKSTSPPGAETGIGCPGANPWSGKMFRKPWILSGNDWIKPKILRKFCFEKLHKGNSQVSMVQNFSPFQGRKFSRFTAWTSEVDDIIAYVNGEIQVILGVFLLDFTIWTYCRRKRNRWFEMIICADRSETVARSIGMEFGGGLNGTVFRSPPSCPLYTRGACAQKPLSGTVHPNTQARYKSGRIISSPPVAGNS